MQVPSEQSALHDLHQLQGDIQGDRDELVDQDHEAQELHQDCAAPRGQVGKHPAGRRASVTVAGKAVAVGRGRRRWEGRRGGGRGGEGEEGRSSEGGRGSEGGWKREREG